LKKSVALNIFLVGLIHSRLRRISRDLITTAEPLAVLLLEGGSQPRHYGCEGREVVCVRLLRFCLPFVIALLGKFWLLGESRVLYIIMCSGFRVVGLN